MTRVVEAVDRLSGWGLLGGAFGETHPGVRPVRALKELDSIQDGWNSLAFKSGSPMLSCDWTRACAEVFGLGPRLEVLLYGAAGMAAVAPLFRPGTPSGRREFIGASELGEPMDFLYSDPSAVTPLAEALAERGCSLLLRRVPSDSPTIDALKRAYKKVGFVLCRPAGGFPRLTLDARWCEPERNLSSGRRSDLRRMRSIAAKFGPIQVQISKPRADDLKPLLDEAYEVEAGGWKAAEGSALALDLRRGPFFRRYAAAACERGLLRLCFLRLGERAAAVQIAIESARSFWLLKIGYREEFARCSPGTLLMHETISYAATAGLQSYEFLGRDEAWLHMWRPLTRPCVSLAAYPRSVPGAIALGQDALSVLRQKAPVIRKWR